MTGVCKSSGKTTYNFAVSPGTTQVASSYTAFKAALLIEPLDISFEAVASFTFYNGGVYKPNDCNNKASSINHAM